jgi:hypothetical protein
MIYCSRDFNCCHDNIFFQHILHHTVWLRNHFPESKNRPTCQCFSPTQTSSASPRGQDKCHEQTTWRHLGSKYLVLIKNHWYNQKEISTNCSPPWECGQISTTSLTGTWFTSPWRSGHNSQPLTYSALEMQLGAFHQLHVGTLPDWGLTLVQPGDNGIYYHSMNPKCKCKSPWSFWVFTTINSFKLLRQCLHHSRCGPSQPPHHQTHKIISNYLQLRSSLLLPPRRHLLLQRKESDGDKFEKGHSNLQMLKLSWLQANSK